MLPYGLSQMQHTILPFMPISALPDKQNNRTVTYYVQAWVATGADSFSAFLLFRRLLF